MIEKTKNSSNAEDLLIIAQMRLFGNTDAFGRLVNKYQSPLRRYLYHLTFGNRALADDIAQESFIKAFTHIKTFQGGSFHSWLFRIAYRQFVDTYRTYRYHEEFDCEQHKYTIGSEEDKIPLLEQTLTVLNEQERHLVLLNCIEECSHSQIAKITTLPLGSIKTILSRAKEKLRKHLKNDGAIL